ncbi:MAG: alpha/beta hydrolase [Clostridia bacterium]|nr:alpha/beta hydrolase [Clostridia bacterium]
MILSKDTTLRDLNEAPELAAAKDALIAGGNYFEGETAELSLSDLQDKFGTWNADDMLFGLERLLQLLERGVPVVHPVYAEAQIAHDPRKAQAKLFWFPADKEVRKANAPYVILASGGAYGSVCTLPESLPVAAELNRLGYDAFCLNYRTALPEDIQTGLFPMPADDYAAGWHTINDHAEEFGVCPENYFAGGFSAGGHLTALWGTEHLGARHYGIPQPRMLLLDYPLISMDTTEDGPVKTFMTNMMFGADHDRSAEEAYLIHHYVDNKYPPVYHVQAKDDPTVAPINASLLKEALEQFDVPCQQELLEHGGHGFGLGSGTEAEGWVERAIRFYERMEN